MDIILYLLNIIQEQRKQISWLLSLICKYLPVKQWVFEDCRSPEYQKFKVDKLPHIIPFEKHNYKDLIEIFKLHYGKTIKPVSTHSSSKRNVSPEVCCPYCGHHLQPVKTRKQFVVHKCVNDNCSYYIRNKKKLPKNLPDENKHLYKLRYIYREFALDFFKMNLHSLPTSLLLMKPILKNLVVSAEWRWCKQVLERLNRTFKSTYRNSNGYTSDNGALYGVSLWVAYYNFLRPHPYNYWKPLNMLDEFDTADNMPAKCQILIKLGQLKILELQKDEAYQSTCS